MQQMREWVEEAGRDWASFGVEQRINVAAGTPDDWRQTADEWRELGATHLSLVTTGGGLEGAGGSHRAAARGEGGSSRDRAGRRSSATRRSTRRRPSRSSPSSRRRRRRRSPFRRCSRGRSRGGFSSFSSTASMLAACSRSARTAATRRCRWRQGLPPDGRIDTCEIDEQHAEVARRYIARSPYADRITVHLGPAIETISQARRRVRLRLHRRRQGGLHRLLRGRSAAALRAWSDRRRQHAVRRARLDGPGPRSIAVQRARPRDERVICVLLPVRDGVTLIRRRP